MILGKWIFSLFWSTGRGAPRPKSRYAFAGAPFVALAALRSVSLARFAPLHYSLATNYATAKAPLDFGLVGPSLWTLTATLLYSTNLVSFALGVWI